MKSCDFLKSRLNEGFLDDFFNAILDKTQGSTTEVALKNFTSEFSQKLGLFISQAIKTGKIDKTNLTTLDPNTGNPIVPTPPAGTPPATTDTDSIAEYTYKYINNLYKPDFDQKEKKIYITLLNDLQAKYATDGGRDALGKLGALLFDDGTQKTFKKDTDANRPAEASAMPTRDITIYANVGNNRQKFSFAATTKTWTDQSGKPVTDAKSIDALNDIANRQPVNKPADLDLSELTPNPTTDIDLNTKSGIFSFDLASQTWRYKNLKVADKNTIEKLNQAAQKKIKANPKSGSDLNRIKDLINSLSPADKASLLQLLNTK